MSSCLRSAAFFVGFALVILAVPGPTAVVATEAAADDARRIVEEAQKRTIATSQRYEGLLQVFDAKGKISDKRWTFERLGSHGRSKAVLRFTGPPEVKGIALLVINHPDRASDQWMWTPALERDRRIALQDRSTRFFGTDFSFEDLEERDVDQYEYRSIGDEAIDGALCWKIQSTPKEAKSSQYTRSHLCVRAHRELHQGSDRSPAELPESGERAGDLDGARPRDVGSSPRQPDAPHPRPTPIQRPEEG
jgi:hypothetical protein